MKNVLPKLHPASSTWQWKQCNGICLDPKAFLALIRGKPTRHIQNKIKILRVHDWGRSMRNQKELMVIIGAPSP